MTTSTVVNLTDLEKLSDLNDRIKKFTKENAGLNIVVSVTGTFNIAKYIDAKTQKKQLMTEPYTTKHLELGIVKTVWMVGQDDSNQTVLLKAEDCKNVAFTLTALSA